MRELIEKTVYKNFVYNLEPFTRLKQGSDLNVYIKPMHFMKQDEKKRWLTDIRLREIRKMLTLISNKQLLKCLTEQHCSQFC